MPMTDSALPRSSQVMGQPPWLASPMRDLLAHRDRRGPGAGHRVSEGIGHVTRERIASCDQK